MTIIWITSLSQKSLKTFTGSVKSPGGVKGFALHLNLSENRLDRLTFLHSLLTGAVLVRIHHCIWKGWEQGEGEGAKQTEQLSTLPLPTTSFCEYRFCIVE